MSNLKEIEIWGKSGNKKVSLIIKLNSQIILSSHQTYNILHFPAIKRQALKNKILKLFYFANLSSWKKSKTEA